MQAGLYSEKDELIMDWDTLIKKEYIEISNSFLCKVSKEIEGKLIIDKKIDFLESNSFENCSVTEIVLPDTLCRIYSNAFINCKELKRINIPDNLNTLNTFAFSHCKNLKEINLNNISEIRSYVFQNCEKLNEIILPKNLKKIGKGIFFECFELNNIIYLGTEEEFKKIEGWENIFNGNKLTIENIKYMPFKTLEDLINEGKTLIEANKMIKKQQEIIK